MNSKNKDMTLPDQLSLISKCIQENCSQESIIFPKRFVKTETFFTSLKSINSINEKIPSLLTSLNTSEFRLISLLKNLSIARQKFNVQKRLQYMQDNDTMSPLQITNKIIKSSYELTSYIYLMKWLQEYFAYQYNGIDLNAKKLDYSKQTSYNGVNEQPDCKDFAAQLNRFILTGDIKKAQEQCVLRNMHHFSAMLNGGLPLHDSTTANDSYQIDFELFPNYMKNKDLDGLINRSEDIIGNSNWIMWLSSLYDIDFSNFNNVFNAISGNTKRPQKYLLEPMNEAFYMHLMNLFNSSLMENILSDSEGAITYHYTADEFDNMNKIRAYREGKTIYDIINMFRGTEEYKNRDKNNILFNLELRIIEAHFLAKDDIDLFYEKINEMLDELLFEFQQGNLALLVSKIVGNAAYKNQILGITLKDLDDIKTKNQNMVLAAYSRIIFETLICFYDVYEDFLSMTDNKQYEQNLNAYYYKHDELLIIYAIKENIIQINPDISVIVSIFMFNLDKIKSLFSTISQSVEGEQSFGNFVESIKKYFEGEIEGIKENIANSGNFFNIRDTRYNSIEEAVQNVHKTENQSIRKEDQEKIIKIIKLFDDHIKEEIALNYLIKLLFYFISLNKYKEALFLFESSKKLKPNFLKDSRNDDEEEQSMISIFETDKTIAEIECDLENIDDKDKQKTFIKFLLFLLKNIIDCFFAYHNLQIVPNISDISRSKRSIDYLNNNSLKVNRLIKLMISNSELYRFITLRFLREEEKIVEKVICDWAAQTAIWASKILSNDVLLDDQVKAIEIIESHLLFNDVMFANSYLDKFTTDPDYEKSYLSKEVDFYNLARKYHQKGLLQAYYLVCKTKQSFMQDVLDEKIYKGINDEIDELDFD